MLTIRFFASIREAVDIDHLNLEWPNHAKLTVADIIDQLKTDHPRINTVLTSNKPLIAINQTMANLSSSLNDGDELAFFPPMTGG